MNTRNEHPTCQELARRPASCPAAVLLVFVAIPFASLASGQVASTRIEAKQVESMQVAGGQAASEAPGVTAAGKRASSVDATALDDLPELVFPADLDPPRLAEKIATPSLNTPSLNTPSLNTPSLNTPSLNTPSLNTANESSWLPRQPGPPSPSGTGTADPPDSVRPVLAELLSAPPTGSTSATGTQQSVSDWQGIPFQPLKPIPADEPQLGENFFPQHDHAGGPGTWEVPYSSLDFSPDPDGYIPFDPWTEADIYQGKKLNANQRPLLELGKPFYQLGQLPVSETFLGRTNLVHPRFQIFGDFRTAVGLNGLGDDYQGVWGAVLNLQMDLRITATERFHALVAPLDRIGDPTRLIFDDGGTTFINNTDLEFDTGFFEGDLGALAGGAVGEVLPFDLPITIGAIPLLYQNGIWMNDAFIGMAAAIPARNSPRLDISNFDVVFFWGFDNITSPAFQGDDNAAKMYGIQLFLETLNGYIESGYAFLEDRSALDRSYHNITASYTRRYGRFVSNSVRVLANAGQNPNLPFKTADGVLLLMENSLITRYPSRIVPYCNLFAGFGRVQSVARQVNAGGVLQNTGINFETDGVTNFPILDPTANDTYGGALGVNILAPEFTQQLILETAFLDVMGNDPFRAARGRQVGFGVRYQLPISNAVILRADAMHGLRQNEADLSGFRVELRHKF